MRRHCGITDARIMKTRLIVVATALSIAALSGCMKWEDGTDPDLEICPGASQKLFIANEGQWSYGNASLSCYDTGSGSVGNDVFYRANGQKLGDTAQSMTLHDGTLWIVVNSSNVIFAVDPVSFREKGRITEGLNSPRYIHFVSDGKAYITQMGSGDILIADPQSYSITGKIETGASSTEQIVQTGEYAIVNCWSYQKEILKIDTRTDAVTGRLETGVQPAAMQFDCNGKLWVINDGGGSWTEETIGSEAPTLKRIDPENLVIEHTLTFPEGSSVNTLEMNSGRDSLFFLQDGVMAMSIADPGLPDEPVADLSGLQYPYGLAIRPGNSEIFVSDALDFMQDGAVSRFSSGGELLDRFKTGVGPGAFCWY